MIQTSRILISSLEQENRERDEKFKKEIEQSRKREEKLNNRIEQLQNENADLKQTVSDLETELGVLEKKVNSFVAKMRAREAFIRLVSFLQEYDPDIKYQFLLEVHIT